MPKEPGHSGERGGGWSSSKNAKERSNTATVQADRGGHRGAQPGPGALGGRGGGPGPLGAMGDMGEQLSRFNSEKDSEKDSGYSEAGSDSVQNDRGDGTQTHRKNSRNAVTAGNHGSVGGGLFDGHRAVYVINNLLVEPSRQEQMLHGQLAQAAGWHRVSGPQGPAQLLLIQQPAVTAPTSSSSTSSSSFFFSSSSSSSLTAYSAPGEPLKGFTGRPSGRNHHSASKNSYLPILHSYPRIAPHPRKEGHAQGTQGGAPPAGQGGGAGGEGQSQSKRACTVEELKKESATAAARHLSSHHHHGLHPSQHEVRRGSEPPPAASLTSSPHRRRRHSHQSSDAAATPSASSSQTPSSLPSAHSSSSSSSHSPSSSSSSSDPASSSSSSSSSVTHSPYRPRPVRAGPVRAGPAVAAAGGHLSDAPSEGSSVRQRRFLNTAEVLSRSGLLAVTLRTKELQQQSERTARDIAQLRLHTQLLCQAALAGQQVANDGSNGLRRLLRAMGQSGSYPGLDPAAQLKAVGDSWEGLTSPQGADDDDDEGVSSLSPFFGLSPEAERMEQVNSLAGSLSMDQDLSGLFPESFTFHNYLF